MPTNATLEDVARNAGVHRSTASLSLRDHPRIPEKTRQRVKAAARRLGYRINPLVASLMQSRRLASPTLPPALAFLAPPSAADPSAADALRSAGYFAGAARRARDLGFKLERFCLDEPGAAAAGLSDRLSRRLINGVLVGPTPAPTPDLAWTRFSVVALGGARPSPALHRVTENHFDVARHAVERCRERGYRRVGLVFSAAADSPEQADRWQGAATLTQLHLSPEEPLLVCPGRPAGEAAFARWFLHHQPDALLTNHPRTVACWLEALGRRLPGDVGLVGLGVDPSSRFTAIGCAPARIGGAAVELLLGLMHRHETGLPPLPHEILLGGTWQEHGSLPPRTEAFTQSGPPTQPEDCSRNSRRIPRIHTDQALVRRRIAKTPNGTV